MVLPFLHIETVILPLALYCLLVVALLLRHDRPGARWMLYFASALAITYQVFLAAPTFLSPFIVVLRRTQEAYGDIGWKSLLMEVQRLFVVAIVLMSALEARSFAKKQTDTQLPLQPGGASEGQK